MINTSTTQTQPSLLSSLISNPFYKNLNTPTPTNGKLPITNTPTAKTPTSAIDNSKLLPKTPKNDKLQKSKSKKSNSNSSSSVTVTPNTAQPAVTPTNQNTTVNKATPDNLTIPKSVTPSQTLTPTPTVSSQQPKSATPGSANPNNINNANKKKPTLFINQKTPTIDSMATQHVKPVCANCGVNHTPLWRRSANDEILCNACGLYQKLHKVPRPKSIRQHAVRKDTQAMTEHETTECSNCHTTNTPLWRRDENGATLCNACGLYQKMHHSARPISMKTDLPRKRQRFDSLPSIGLPSPALLSSTGISNFLPYGNLCYPINFGGIPTNFQNLYNPLARQPAISPSLSDKSDKSSKTKKKIKTPQPPVPQKKIKLSAPSPTMVDNKKK